MLSTSSIINKLRSDHPDIRFEEGDVFLWSPGQNTVFYTPNSKNTEIYLLHELSHALLGHKGYYRDIELLKLERDAWHHAAANLSSDYEVSISDEFVQDNLDTYRVWLNDRSTCPNCSYHGIQRRSNLYKCIACSTKWTVNEAKSCALRRHKVIK